MDKLVERLRDAMRRVGAMASEGRPPKMSIPARPDHDDDIFICDAIRDAISALTADAGMERAAEIRGMESAREIAWPYNRSPNDAREAGRYDAAHRIDKAIRAASAQVNAEPVDERPPFSGGCAPATDTHSTPDVGQVVACPKCERKWLRPCEQTICIELHGECISCRFVKGTGTVAELAQISELRAAGSRHES